MIRGPLQFPSSAEEKIKTAENKFFLAILEWSLLFEAHAFFVRANLYWE
jgi:hypothetical protein